MNLDISAGGIVDDNILFKAKIVELILMGFPERALELLSKNYRVRIPKLAVGLVKGKSRAAGVYVMKNRTIYVSKGENLFNPLIILHEFYHHLRTRSDIHKGTERHADIFAKEFLDAHNRLMTSLAP